MQPRLSVVVPIRNAEPYLTACLESIAGQTLSCLQAVLVDDGCTDGSSRIAADFAARDPRFHHVRQDHRPDIQEHRPDQRGHRPDRQDGRDRATRPGAARNTGVAATPRTVEFLAFADADDVVPHDAYARLIASLDGTGSAFATGNVWRLGPRGRWQAPAYDWLTEGRTRTHITRDPRLLADRSARNKVFRRAFWDRHALSFPEGRRYGSARVVIPAHFLAGSVDVLPDHVCYQRARHDTDARPPGADAKAARDRVAACDHISRFLAVQQPAHKTAYDLSCLRADLLPFLAAVPAGSPDYRRTFLTEAADFLSRVSPEAFAALPAGLRAAWQLVRRRRSGELLALLADRPIGCGSDACGYGGGGWDAHGYGGDGGDGGEHEGEYGGGAAGSRSGGWARRPGRAGPAAVARVREISWDADGRLRITGCACPPGHPAARPRQSVRTGVLVSAPEPGRGGRGRLPGMDDTERPRGVRAALGLRRVRRVPTRAVPHEPDGGTEQPQDAHDVPAGAGPAGFEMTVDPAKLKVKGAWQPGDWLLGVLVAGHGTVRHAALHAEDDGAARAVVADLGEPELGEPGLGEPGLGDAGPGQTGLGNAEAGDRSSGGGGFDVSDVPAGPAGCRDRGGNGGSDGAEGSGGTGGTGGCGNEGRDGDGGRSKGAPGAGAGPRGGRLRLEVGFDAGLRLRLRVVEQPAVFEWHRREGNDLVLGGRVHGDVPVEDTADTAGAPGGPPGTPRALRLSRPGADGGGTGTASGSGVGIVIEAPLTRHAPEHDGGRFEVRVPLARLADIPPPVHRAPKEVPPPYAEPWRAELVMADGTLLRPAAVPALPPGRYALHNGRELCATADDRGRLRIELTARPIAETVTWADDGTLTITGTLGAARPGTVQPGTARPAADGTHASDPHDDRDARAPDGSEDSGDSQLPDSTQSPNDARAPRTSAPLDPAPLGPVSHGPELVLRHAALDEEVSVPLLRGDGTAFTATLAPGAGLLREGRWHAYVRESAAAETAGTDDVSRTAGTGGADRTTGTTGTTGTDETGATNGTAGTDGTDDTPDTPGTPGTPASPDTPGTPRDPAAAPHTTREDPPPAETPLRTLAPLAAALPVRRTAGGRAFTVDRRHGDHLIVEAGSLLPPADRTPYRQHHLRTAHYPRQRTEPLREAVLYPAGRGADALRAVHEELVRRGTETVHLWVTRDRLTPVPPLAHPVEEHSAAWYEALARCRRIVASDHLPEWFVRRPDQTVVQTWHGVPVRRIGTDLAGTRYAHHARLEALPRRAAQWSVLVSPNRFATRHLCRALGYDGELLQAGSPRNDLLFSADRDKVTDRVRRELGIPDECRVILYAPTYRDHLGYPDPGVPGGQAGHGGRRGPGCHPGRHDGHEGAHRRYACEPALDFRAAERALGADHVLLVRRHPLTTGRLAGARAPFVRDVTRHPHAAELLLVADVLITDYSSLMVDYAHTGRPMLFLTPDLAHYGDPAVRGFTFDFAGRAPGPLLASTEEVLAALADLPAVTARYADAYAAFREAHCDLDDGRAAARVADRLMR